MDELSPRNIDAQELVTQIKLGEASGMTLDELRPMIESLLKIEHEYQKEVHLANARKTMGMILQQYDERYADLPSNLSNLETQIINTGAYYAIQNQ